MKTLAEIWLRNRTYNADRTALIFAGKHIDYATLTSRALRLGNALRGLGLRKHDRVAMLSTNRLEWIDVYGASHLFSTILATVNYRLAPPETQYILNDASPRALIFEEQYTGVVDEIRSKLSSVEHFICIGTACPDWATRYDALVGQVSDSVPDVLPRPDDFSTIVYTSGTTGRPKGCLKSQAQNLVGYERNVIVMGLTGADRMLLTMPFYHVGAPSLAFGTWCAGGMVVLHDKFTPQSTLETWHRERITTAHLAPTMLQQVMDEPNIDDFDLSAMRMINCAAAPMPVSLLRRCVDKFGTIFINTYGSTEAAGTILYPHQHHLTGTPAQRRRLGSVGEPFPDAEIRIVDESGIDLPAGQAGEIAIRSPGMLTAYWNNHAATIDAVRDGWYFSGDMGFLDEDGFLYLVDRKKDMIVSGGENIYCREVEEAILEHEKVADVAVISVPHEKWGETVKAIVVLKPDTTLGEQELIDFTATRIARYKKPSYIDFVASLPRLPSGKVNKVELRQTHGGAQAERSGAMPT